MATEIKGISQLVDLRALNAVYSELKKQIDEKVYKSTYNYDEELGVKTTPYNNAYIRNHVVSYKDNTYGELRFERSTKEYSTIKINDSNNFVVSNSIIPSANNTLSLGTSNVKFNSIYATELNITNASLGGTLSVTGKSTLGELEASSLNVTGNTTIGGTLGVTGATTLSNTLGVTGNTSLSTLGTTGKATLNSLGVTNNTTVGGTLGVTGNTSLSTLGTTDKATLNSLAVALGTTIGTTLDVTGNTSLKGTLTVALGTTLSNTLSVGELATLKKGLSVATGGIKVLAGGLNVTGNTTLNNSLTVTSTTELKNNVSITGGTYLQVGVASKGLNIKPTSISSVNTSDKDKTFSISSTGNTTITPGGKIFTLDTSGNLSIPGNTVNLNDKCYVNYDSTTEAITFNFK